MSFLFEKIKKGFDNLVKGDSTQKQEKPSGDNIEITFEAEKLGLTLSKGPNGRPVITNVARGGDAHRGGLSAGDVVTAIEGNEVHSYEDVMEVLQAIGRPVRIAFQKNSKDTTASPVVKTEAKSAPEAKIVAEAKESMTQSLGWGKKTQKPPELTEEERQERREAALKATEQRVNKWDKKIQSSKNEKLSKKGAEEKRNAAEDPQYSEETRKMLEASKVREQAEVEKLGYNPFQAAMSSNQQVRAVLVSSMEPAPAKRQEPPAISNSVPSNSPLSVGRATPMPTPGQVEQPLSPADFIDDEQAELIALNQAAEDSMFQAHIEDALAILMSQGEDKCKPALTTIHKLTTNIVNSPNLEKFRKVRMGNTNFNDKVGSVNGGPEVMLAIGFELDTSDENEAVFVYPEHEALHGVRLRAGITKLQEALQMMV